MMVGKDAVYVSTKVFIAELISLLIFSILRQLLLDSVIGEMHSPLSSHKRVLSWCGPHVSITIPIAFESAVYASYQDIVSDIKFPIAVKQRSFYVCLNDISTIRAVTIALFCLDCCTYFFKCEANLYSIPSIAILARFDYPSIVLLANKSVTLSFGDLSCPLLIVLEKIIVLLIF